MPEITPIEWQDYLSGAPDSHILQTPQWAEVKSRFGWKPRFLATSTSDKSGWFGALILFRKLPFGISAGYVAKGPVWSPQPGSEIPDWTILWQEIDQLCREEKAVFLKIEPDLWEINSFQEPTIQMLGCSPPPGFQSGFQMIQPARTLIVDLNGSEEEILSRMKQKTRYNIRLASRKGVVVKPSSDIEAFHRLMMLTSERDQFGVHNQEYYQLAYDLFHSDGSCELLAAEAAGEILSALMVFRRGSRSWYFYGASSNQQRELMPTYLLQWEAMRWAKLNGCTSYDLWGVPDQEESELEKDFLLREDGLWGVYRFKRGFGGKLYRACGPWDRVYKPLLYKFYRMRSGRAL